jgi:hypothetical protein
VCNASVVLALLAVLAADAPPALPTPIPTEIVDAEGGFRVRVPIGWEARRAGDRVVLTDPDGLLDSGALAISGSRIWLRPIADPDNWFEQLLNRDETRDVKRQPAENDRARFEYIDALSRRGVDQHVSIECRRLAGRWICGVLEFRVDDPGPAAHRQRFQQVLDSLQPMKR